MKDPKNDYWKAVALDNDVDIAFAQARRKAFFDFDNSAMDALKQEWPEPVIKASRNINTARYKRACRCRKKVEKSVFENNAYFITLTFTDKVLSDTTEKERRVKVSRWLKSVSKRYVANIDYGDKKKNPQSHEREHYHALVESPSGKPPKTWPCGWVDIRKCGNSEKDLAKVAKYTAKLSAHALKASTSKGAPKCPRLIYSRNCLK